MENTNENPVTEPVVVEAPVVIQAPVVEAPVVEEPTPAEPVVEEVPVTPAPVEPTVISAPERPQVQALGNVNGAIGATTVPVVERVSAKKATEKKETVALYSTKNVTWSTVGKVYRGYNIVDKNDAEKWLTRSHIRVATPEEVAKEFGK